MTAEDIYWGSMLAQAEMIASGTTLFHDMYTFMPQVAQAAEISGMKALLGRGATYFGDSPFEKHQGSIESIELYKEYNNFTSCESCFSSLQFTPIGPNTMICNS